MKNQDKHFENISEEEEKAASLELHKPSTPLSEWTDEDLEWGLVGCAHDMDHALDLIKKADDESDAYAAGLEFLNVMATRAAYKKEQFRRWEEQQ